MKTSNTLAGIVKECLKSTPDRGKVRRKVLDELEGLKPMRDELLTPLIMDAVNAEIAQAVHRDKSWHKSNASNRDLAGASALHEALAASILDTWHVGSKRLGDMTRDELAGAASDERARAKGHILNADFYEALAQDMNEKQTVRQKFKPDAVRKVLADAQQQPAMA